MATKKDGKDDDPLARLMEVDEDGLTFANKTAQWIAYERHVESERSDRLFYDPLAKHLAGKYGKMLSDFFSTPHAGYTFPGLGDEGFIRYHAARTKLISSHIEQWSTSIRTLDANAQKQVLNLGAGYDSRAFWDASLADVDLYIEVDEAQVNGAKENLLQQTGTDLPKLICPRQCISLDFAKETALDVSKHGFRSNVPTLWILEGIIMYLEKDAVQRLYKDIVTLSCEGSYVIVNVVQTSKEHHRAEFADSIFLADDAAGWTRASSSPQVVMFGDEAFDFGRYNNNSSPVEALPPNKNLGFCFYEKVKG